MICITRFNDLTYKENREWCKKNIFHGCIYGLPVKINNNIPVDTTLFIFEMNNSINKIVGIGMLVNKNDVNIKRYKIYSDNNYNRFTYFSNYRIDILEDYLPLVFIKNIKLLEELVFFGKTHIKRGQGIQNIPLWIYDSTNKTTNKSTNKTTNNFDIKKFLLMTKSVFNNKYDVSINC